MKKVKPGTGQGLSGILHDILVELGLEKENMTIEVIPHVPRAMGLGGSSALAVAIIRAVDEAFSLSLTNERINRLAYECEKAAHGTPSGIDNTIATYGTPLLYQRNATQDSEGGGMENQLAATAMAVQVDRADAQSDRQPSPETVLPSSHTSVPSRMALPQNSGTQVGPQPSPAVGLASSHVSSPAWMRPSPQRGPRLLQSPLQWP